jgi:hypothetical protein
VQLRVLFFACTLTYGIIDALGALEHSLPAALGYTTHELSSGDSEGGESRKTQGVAIQMSESVADCPQSAAVDG